MSDIDSIRELLDQSKKFESEIRISLHEGAKEIITRIFHDGIKSGLDQGVRHLVIAIQLSGEEIEPYIHGEDNFDCTKSWATTCGIDSGEIKMEITSQIIMNIINELLDSLDAKYETRKGIISNGQLLTWYQDEDGDKTADNILLPKSMNIKQTFTPYSIYLYQYNQFNCADVGRWDIDPTNRIYHCAGSEYDDDDDPYSIGIRSICNVPGALELEHMLISIIQFP